MEDKNFGLRFTKLMEQRNISNKRLTELAEISKNNVGNYQKGQIPNALILYRLSQIFGVSMEYMLTGKENEDLTTEEQQLVKYYRSGNEAAQQIILQSAKTTSEQLPREQKSSTSKIG